MIPLARFKEKSFEILDSALNELESKERRDYLVLAKDLSLEGDGKISGPRFKGRLSQTGMNTLLGQLKIPYSYAYSTCPNDLLIDSINRLFNSSDKTFRVRTLSNIVTSVLPAKAEPVDHHFIIKYCLKEVSGIVNITLNDRMMRINTTTVKQIEVLPDDRFKTGWDIVNFPDGLYPLQADVLLYRMICSNGAYGFENFASYRRRASESINEALNNLKACITQTVGGDVLKNSLISSNQERLGQHFERIKKEIEMRIGTDSWELNLSEVNPGTTWYDLFNRITLTAQRYPLNIRRKYEYLGGEILSLFLNPKSKKRWLSKSPAACDGCELVGANMKQ